VVQAPAGLPLGFKLRVVGPPRLTTVVMRQCRPLSESSSAALKKTRIVLVFPLALLPLAIWGLYALATMPYRTPQDMNTFLGGGEILFGSSPDGRTLARVA
jgi:hypothetical protein